MMKLVLIESPFAGDVETNLRYLKACMLDSFNRGEAPFASHKLYTDVLDDDVTEQRALGISAGLAWGQKADFTALYVDRGVSGGMRLGIKAAVACGRLIVERRLGGEWALEVKPPKPCDSCGGVYHHNVNCPSELAKCR